MSMIRENLMKHSTKGREPSDVDIVHVLANCRKNKWDSVLKQVRDNPRLATAKLPMENHIITTILHQAITAKGDTERRAMLILHILKTNPLAAGVPNGYASYPLHSIAQRNTKMDAKTKEMLIFALIEAYPNALLKQNNQGQRTPLHVLFTDYISPQLTKTMIDTAPDACFIKDRKGYLPAHIACSRHCSPEKLHMLISVNPHALYEETYEGDTLLSLAKNTATKSHPNKTLIDALEALMAKDRSPNLHGRLFIRSTMDALVSREKLPACPPIVPSIPMLSKKVPVKSKRSRYFTFEPIESSPSAVSLDLTIEEVSKDSLVVGTGPLVSWQDDTYETPRRPLKKRKKTIFTGPKMTTNHCNHHEDDKSDTATLLLNLSARVSPPCVSEKTAAEALTQFAQV